MFILYYILGVGVVVGWVGSCSSVVCKCVLGRLGFVGAVDSSSIWWFYFFMFLF